MSSQSLEHSGKFMSIEEFGRYIQQKNHALIEEKKRKYSYIDRLGQEYKPLTPTRMEMLEEESCNLNLREEISTVMSSTTSSKQEVRYDTLKTKLQQLSKGKPTKLENPFRKIVCCKDSKQEYSYDKSLLKFGPKKFNPDDTESS